MSDDVVLTDDEEKVLVAFYELDKAGTPSADVSVISNRTGLSEMEVRSAMTGLYKVGFIQPFAH